ncbi:hypothetical protein TRFO_22148 [Tritrichomonas foetus]|uniref:HECT domain-containing protein n=1 Tax=Tritrichomonas foetus TaxID=1144522 RepID=A0A1J4KHJ2_9EUKA|nr:hypothetical protein TRFO_22148 [Tritrichomonas foetus]|eukprot:OHT09134.1 hypothetical protein TRFO_22148 [Tritrichomonas foetus]
MGQTPSRPKDNAHYRYESQNSIAKLPFGDIHDPIFYYEGTLHYFSFNHEKSSSSKAEQRHKVEEIGNLLMYSLEQLTNIPGILDHVIKSTDLNDPSVLINLQNEFSSYIMYGSVRSEMIITNRYFLTKFNAPHHEILKNKEMKNPNFSDLLHCFQEAYNCATKRKFDKTIIKKFSDMFSTCVPVSAFPAPTSDYLPQIRGHSELFTARYVNCHGTSSNGQFLFVLCADSRIQIFPLLNMGSLMHPIHRELNITVDYKASLVATKTEIIIYTSSHEYVFQFEKLFSTPEGTLVEPSSKTAKTSDAICYLADCFTYAKIRPDFSVTIFNLVDGKKLRTIKLTESSAPRSSEFSQLFPEYDYSLVPILMNGAFIGFVFVVDPTTTIFRVFSLITGKHVLDEIFRSPDQFYSGCSDMVTKSHWVVSLMENNRLGVRRYYFAGSYEPFPYLLEPGDLSARKPFSAFINYLNNLVMHYAGSLVVSPLFIADNTSLFLAFIDVFTQFIRIQELKKKDDYNITMQTFCVIADINLRHLDQNCPEAPQIKDKMYTIIAELPLQNAAFLFFGSLKFFLRKIEDIGISFLVGLFKNLEVPSIRCYAISHIPDTFAMAFIPFNITNALSQLMPTTPQSKSEAGSTPQTLLLLHQRIMILAALSFLETTDKCEQQFDPNQQKLKAKNILNFLYEYSIIITTNFENIMEQCSSFIELEESFILMLLTNFVMVLSSLTEYRVIAEVLTPVFAPLVSRIVEYIELKGIDINDESDLSHMILGFIVLYSKLIATLLQGSDLSDFEKQYIWLFKDVVKSVEEAKKIEIYTSKEIEDFEDQELDNFIKGKTEIMTYIYKKYKPMMNKKLSKAIQQEDRLVLSSICKWTGSTQELMEYNESKRFSENFRAALDWMMRIRSQIRSMKQHNQPTDDIIIKCLMLLRFERIEATPTPQEVANFILTKQSPEMIIYVIKQKHLRNDLTLLGFDLAARILDIDNLDIFTRLFAHNLAQIHDFEGLNAILSIFTPTQQQNEKIVHFFDRVLQIVVKNPYPKLMLVAFRIFRDCNKFPEIEATFLVGILKIIDKSPERIPAFALAISLMQKTKFIPETLMNLSLERPGKLVLLAEGLKGNDCTVDFYDKAEEFFWTTPSNHVRPMCRVLYFASYSKLLKKRRVRSFITKVIDYIGEQLIKYNDLVGASEMVWLVKKMLVNGGRPAKIIYSLIEKEKHSDARICGIFAVLNGYIEILRPFCSVRIHFNRTSTMECIAAYDTEKDSWICYPLPFSLKNKVLRMQFSPQDEIYAIDLETISTNSFNNFDFILRYFDHCFADTTSVFASLYVKSFSSFLRFPEFGKLLTDKHIQRISRYLVPFNDINGTIRSKHALTKKTVIPSKCGFGVLHFKDNKYTTYLSPQIKKKEVFTVKFKVSDFTGYFGIITDNQDRFYTRYSLVQFPSGRWYPFNTPVLSFPEDAKEITFTVDRGNHKFFVGDQKMIFPIGSRFRVLIAVPNDSEFDVETDFSVFDLNAPPSIQHHGNLFGNNKSSLYTLPESINSLEKTVWADINKYEEIPDIVSAMNVGLKVMENFINPPDYISIHAGFATECSYDIIEALYRGYNRCLVDGWASVSLMRVLQIFPDKVNNLDTLTKLFTLLLVPLENFALSLFNELEFPFDFSEPAWYESAQTNVLFMGLEKEAKETLRCIVTKPGFEARLCSDVQSMTQKQLLHMLAFPHHFHTYYPPGSYPATLRVNSPNAIITMNSFHPIVKDGIEHEKTKYDLPFIKHGGDPMVQLSVLDRSLSILSINPNNNSWIYESAFELLLLMKSFIFFTPDPKFRTAIKSCLIDCFVCQSPFVLHYLPQILEFFQLHMPPTPFDKSTTFIQHLQLLGAFLKTYNGRDKERMLAFYSQEQTVITSRYATEIANFFPEFFPVPVYKPISQTVKIPKMNLDPAAIKEDYAGYIRMLRMYSIRYKTLVGFPFWDILPLWLRISGAWNDEVDKIDPTVEEISPEVMHVINPSQVKIEITITPKIMLTPRAMVMYSDSSEFTNATFVNSKNISHPIYTTAKDTYLSPIDVKDLWKSLTLKVKVKRQKKETNTNEGMPKIIDPRAFHAQFIEEMEEFAVKWSPQDTEKLVVLLPRYALREPKFASVLSIAKGSSLCLKYSQNVVLLRAALIHHFNYIRYKKFKYVPKHLWDSLSSFVSIEDAADAITESIKCGKDDNFPTFQIDRRSAHRLIVDGKGSPSRSIISQLTRQFKKCGKSKLQCRVRPWKIRFTGEQAIDAGGPTRELMTEAAASIFEPTTQLTVITPNGRRGEGPNQLTYIPFDKTGRRYDDYQTIGTFIGMILRTGFSQDLPFAPLVWKFMAKERIVLSDISAIDSQFGEHITRMREAATQENFETHYMFTWAIEQWDGTPITLPGHTDGSIVKSNQVEQYITEAIQFRIRSIMSPLKEMRRAFQTNVAFKKHKMLTGTLLSRMAQGSSVISTEHLKSITVYSVELPGGSKNPYVERYWRAVDRLNDEQKKLLLRFITTLTRLPNPVINPSFKLQIDKMVTKVPDQALPSASTCFNRLHLPTYSDDDIAYQKILYAIQFCQTMENQ